MDLSTRDLRQRLEPLFLENFEKFGELGAAVSVWQEGKELLHLWGGCRDARREQAWTGETIVLVWSATKGIGSACLLHALQEQQRHLSDRVAEFWPEFGQNGKNTITLAQLLSHSAGLCALDRPVDVLDYPAVIGALEEQAPLWPPGSAHGYHARTFGFLLDELVRRIAGISISEYWRKFFGEPMGLDFWIGFQRNSIRALRRSTPPEPGARRNRLSFIATSPPPALCNAKPLLRRMDCTRSAR